MPCAKPSKSSTERPARSRLTSRRAILAAALDLVAELG
jgi:hypothetical protein